MLKFYLTTVVIWMIILQSTFSLFGDAVRKKIGVNETKKAGLIKRLNILFVLAAVPIIRLILEIVFIYVAICK